MSENNTNDRSQVRAAAYLAAKERLDFRRGKTRALVQCTPPNVKCGNRCIPPEWDCRLKGQGNDPHLAAKRTDPVSGIANIERGIKRLGRFASTGSFSELESSKRSFVRGAVKLKPGTLKEKGEFKEWIENNWSKVVIPVSVVAGGLALHSGLKAGDVFGYKRGAGAKIDNAVAQGISAVLDATPFVGGARAYTRNRAASATAGNLGRIAGRTQRNRSYASNPASGMPETAIPRSWKAGSSDLNKSLNIVNDEGGSNTFYEWNTKHRMAFWGARHANGKSVYAVPTAHAFMNTEWNLNLSNRAIGQDYIVGITSRIEADRDAFLQLARQQGFQVMGRPGAQYIKNDQRDAFVSQVTKAIANDKQRAAQAAYVDTVVRNLAPSSAARNVYEGHVEFYDAYYKKQAEQLRNIAGAPEFDQNLQESGLLEIRRSAERRRVDYLMQTSKKPNTASKGSGHDELFMRDYYHTKVAGGSKSPYTITDRLAVQAAEELAGKQQLSPTQAIQLLNTEYGFTSAEIEVRPGPQRRKARAQAPTPEGGRRAKPRTPAQAISSMMRQKNPDGTPRYATREAAEAAYKRAQEGRIDSEASHHFTPRVEAYLQSQARLDNRLDFTPTGEREGKPCGKSFIPRQLKCSKPATARYAEKEEFKKKNGVAGNIAKGALAAGLAVGSIAAYKNRRAIGSAAGAVRKTIKAERNAYKSILGTKLKQRNSYGRQQYTRRTAQRAAFKEYRTSRQEALSKIYATQSPKYYNAAIQKLSSDDVTKALNALPKSFQESARNLSGKAKAGLAYLSADAQGFKVNKINKESNFSVLSKEDGSKTIAIGSVGDTLVTFNADRSNGSIDMRTEGGGRGLPVYDIQFMTDLSFKQKTGVSKADSTKVASMIKSMNKDSLPTLPQNALLRNIPYSDDGLGRKRGAIYKRFGYTSLEGIRGDYMFATLSNGAVVPIKPEYKSFYADLIKGDDYDTAAEKFAARGRRDAVSPRNDKRCGKSGIPDNQKCTKTTAAVSTTTTSNTTRNIVIGAGALTTVGAVGALALIGVQRGKATAYRRNVPKSALEAEKLAIEYERQFRDKAAQRLGKRPQDVTGFEASAYDYRDKGYDRGFGAFESDPKWYGQTQQSKGSVVILSYADERGQGGFKMAEGGAFKSIWGDRDILPFSNNISQPKSRSGPDDLDMQGERRAAETVGRVAGPVGESAAKTGLMVNASLKRFEFLRDNVNERGFNPDAVRAAAFVVAQRRLTGKSVDILSYSNGGNVATETLAILQEMGYRDVKVVNIAGPTFGMFNHSRDNMRTWVSEGDEFYKATAGKAYTGGNTTMLKNKNIPHGLQDGIDPNNRENGANARANIKAKNSYLLDEQLQKEAYQFLTVDKKRSFELVNEVVWRVAEDKPFDGDLGVLFGPEAATVKTTMASALSNPATKDKAKERIRDLIEDKMLEKWYGGYDPKAVKKTQNAIREELTRNVTRPARSSVKPKRPQTISERISNLMTQNPGMSREAARNQIMRQRSGRSDAYTQSFALAQSALLLSQV
jgi:hypothetical protein